MVDGEEVSIGAQDIVLERRPKPGLVVAVAGELLVALETALTPELEQEGLARELVNRIQSARKVADFEVTQRIQVRYGGPPEFEASVRAFADYIAAETLCTDLATASGRPAGATELDLNGLACWILIVPV
jgi:isoleucyl-tRNA synthetase